MESPWNTIELSGFCEPAGTSISIVPEVAVSRPARMRSSVVLPHPDGPTIMKNSPGAMSSDTRSTAVSPPKLLVRSRMRIAGRAAALTFSAGRRFTAPIDMRGPCDVQPDQPETDIAGKPAPPQHCAIGRKGDAKKRHGSPSGRGLTALRAWAARLALGAVGLGVVGRGDRRGFDDPGAFRLDEIHDVGKDLGILGDAVRPQLLLLALRTGLRPAHLGCAAALVTFARPLVEPCGSVSRRRPGDVSLLNRANSMPRHAGHS